MRFLCVLCVLCVEKVLRFRDFAAAYAGRADAHALGGRAHASVHRTQVNVPAPLGDVMRVTDVISRLRLLAADVALLCHDYSQVGLEVDSEIDSER